MKRLALSCAVIFALCVAFAATAAYAEIALSIEKSVYFGSFYELLDEGLDVETGTDGEEVVGWRYPSSEGYKIRGVLPPISKIVKTIDRYPWGSWITRLDGVYFETRFSVRRSAQSRYVLVRLHGATLYQLTDKMIEQLKAGATVEAEIFFNRPPSLDKGDAELLLLLHKIGDQELKRW